MPTNRLPLDRTVGSPSVSGHKVVAYDPKEEATKALEEYDATGAVSLEDLVDRLDAPRAVWVMVPSGQPTEETSGALQPLLASGDCVIDGGNSNYKDSARRAEKLRETGIEFLDVGTSGGVWGLQVGYSLMVGGREDTFRQLEPIFQTLAPEFDKGYGHVGPPGAGHFAKMVHNGIEYGLMQAYAEGFELMKAKEDFGFDVHQVAEIWRHSSVVRSWLLDLTVRALEEDPDLSQVSSWVGDSGEGRWTVQEGVDLAVPLPVITFALQARFRSRQDQPFGGRLLAAMRNQFGGHAMRRVAG